MDWEHLSFIFALGALHILAFLIEFIFYLILSKRSRMEYTENHYVCMYDMTFVRLLAVVSYVPLFINFFMLLQASEHNGKGLTYIHSAVFFILTCVCVCLTGMMVRQWIEVTDTMMSVHGSRVLKSIDMLDIDQCRRNDEKFVLLYKGHEIMTITNMFTHKNRFEYDLIRYGKLDGRSDAYVRNLERYIDA